MKEFLIIGLGVLIIFFGPYVTIWSLNTLFSLGIYYDIWSWLAAFWFNIFFLSQPTSKYK